MPDAVPEPRSGVMPARRQVSEPVSGGVEEPATQYVAGHTPNGGLFALLHGRGVLKMVRNGLPFTMFDELVGAVGGSQRELAAIIGIPATTLARRKRSGTLTPPESDRLVRIARLEEMAAAMMRSDAAAAGRWLRTPHELLPPRGGGCGRLTNSWTGETPLERAATETGARDVEHLIGRLRHGVFS